MAMLSSEHTAIDRKLHKSFLKKPKYTSLHSHWTRDFVTRPAATLATIISRWFRLSATQAK